MEVKKGYKQTEMGVIPSDWNTFKIGDLIEFQGGSQPDRSTFIYKQKAGYIRLIQIRDYKNNKYETYVPINLAKRFCNKDDIMIGRYGPPIFQILRGIEGAYNVALIKAIPNEKLIKDYAYYFLKQEKLFTFVEKLSQRSSGQTGVDLKELKAYPFPLPPTLAEQTAIATALSDANELIQSLEKLIAKKRTIKQGIMHELLTGKKRLPGFGRKEIKYKQTELGMIPEEWEVKRLGELAGITKLAGYEYSNYFNSYKDGGEIIVIRGTNITNNKLNLSFIKTIPKKVSDSLPRSKLNKNDIVFAYVGTIGPVYLIEENNRYHLGPNTSKITANKLNSPKFLYTYFTSWLIKGEIIEKTSIGAQPSLSMSKIRSFKIITPPTLKEQNAIATTILDMDAEIAALETKLAKYKQIKQGMMQNLLTGRIRLV